MSGLSTSARAAFAVIAACAATAPCAAQGGRALATPLAIERADSLLGAGQVAAAESIFYATSAARPRDGAARLALGRYLAARGAVRVGAVLMEEALRFGADPAEVAAVLAPAYRAMGEWRKLLDLRGAPLSPAERAQTAYLVAHAPSLTMPDSVVATLRAVSGAEGVPGVGRLTVRVGGQAVEALVSSAASGVVLDGALARARGVRATDASGTHGVADSLGVGELTLASVPVRFASTASSGRGVRAIIGLDVLRPWAPTFDPARGRLTLRRNGLAPRALPGTRLPLVWRGDGAPLVVTETGLLPLGLDVVSARLARQRWTVDNRRGEIVIERP